MRFFIKKTFANIIFIFAQHINMKNKKFIFVLVLCFILGSTLLCGCKNATIENINVDGIEISKQNIYLAEGQTSVLSAQVFPFNATNQDITWHSSNNNVVTIENGFVTAVKAGEATIEVTSNDGGYKDKCNVLVTTARDNLELNDYNNLNMPKPEEQYSKLSKKTPLSKRVASNVNKQVNSAKTSAKNVLDDVKTELKNSIDSIIAEKDILSNMQFDNNSIIASFNKMHIDMLESMSNVKQSILNSLESIEQTNSDDYIIDKSDINGVTFVVVKHKA